MQAILYWTWIYLNLVCIKKKKNNKENVHSSFFNNKYYKEKNLNKYNENKIKLTKDKWKLWDKKKYKWGWSIKYYLVEIMEICIVKVQLLKY